MHSSDPTKASGAVRPSKQTARVRHSITLSSVSKALADVINKESGKSSAPEKLAKKPKDVGSRQSRFSVLGTATRASIDVLPTQRDSPEMRTITRHTRSSAKAVVSVEEDSSKLADISSDVSLAKNTSLKPKATSTALPKYRPRSVEPFSRGPSTPPLLNTRHKIMPSPEGKDNQSSPSSDAPQRSVSPRLKRIVKQHTRAASEALSSSLKKEHGPPPIKSKISPGKGGTPSPNPSRAAAVTSTAPTITRPPSAASNAVLLHSPSTPTRKRTVAQFGGVSPHSAPSSPSLGSAHDSVQDSQLKRRFLRKGESSTNSSDSTSFPNTPTQTEGDSYDSIDVELMLGSVVSPTAPTPALPRIKASRENKHLPDPVTPTRPSNFLPSRSNLSYLSPLPPSGDSPPSLRPKPKMPGNDRGSLLSWEQLAAHSSMTQDVDVDKMLSEIPAPFRSGAVSPTPSATFDIPDSPTLNVTALSSPAGYQSISRVLLPEVTPSPAIHRSVLYDNSPPKADDNAAAVTLLRLQLASAENMAKERLEQMKSLEEQLHLTKQARMAETKELSNQVSGLESQLRCSLEARERTDDERAAYTASLEHQLRQLASSRKQDVEAAIAKSKAHSAKDHDVALMAAQRRWDVVCCGKQTVDSWATVCSLTEGHLELIRSNRESLSVILSGLDHVMGSLRSQPT